jgi:hypothetical protein
MPKRALLPRSRPAGMTLGISPCGISALGLRKAPRSERSGHQPKERGLFRLRLWDHSTLMPNAPIGPSTPRPPRVHPKRRNRHRDGQVNYFNAVTISAG